MPVSPGSSPQPVLPHNSPTPWHPLCMLLSPSPSPAPTHSVSRSTGTMINACWHSPVVIRISRLTYESIREWHYELCAAPLTLSLSLSLPVQNSLHFLFFILHFFTDSTCCTQQCWLIAKVALLSGSLALCALSTEPKNDNCK